MGNYETALGIYKYGLRNCPASSEDIKASLVLRGHEPD